MIQWIEGRTDQQLPPYSEEIRAEAVSRSAGKLRNGKKWFTAFMTRNKNMRQRVPQFEECQRMDKALSAAQWHAFFDDHLEPALQLVSYNPEYVYNIDETRFHKQYLLSGSARRVVSSSARSDVCRRRGYQRQWITMIGCISASGHALPPTLLWDSNKVKRHWFALATTDVVIRGTGNGWSNTDIFLDWLKSVFIPNTTPSKTPYKRIVLLLDGSKTHVALPILKVCSENGIEIVCFPSKMTDVIQPLDVSVFRCALCIVHCHANVHPVHPI